MLNPLSLQLIYDEIKKIYKENSDNSEILIEEYLSKELDDLTDEKQIEIIEILADEFYKENPEISNAVKYYEKELSLLKNSFLISQKAYRKTIQDLMNGIVKEFDPKAMEDDAESLFKMGPFKKSQYFNEFEEKYRSFKVWFESGRYYKKFQNDLEKNFNKYSINQGAEK